MMSSQPTLARSLTVAALIGSGLTLSAQPYTLTFDELSFRPVNGVSISGVTFGFEVGGSSSDDASYNALGPGAVTYLDDPVLEGDAAGILSLNFHRDAFDLSFGLSLTSFASIDPAAAVYFYDDLWNPLSFEFVSTEPLLSWTEGQFEAVPSGPFRHVVIEFNSAEASRFAIDNLSYRLRVPDSGGLWAASAIALLSLAGMRRVIR